MASDCASAAVVMGWRGDGTGRYPGADPPTTWGRVSQAVLGLRFQARRPKEGDAGQPMPDGVIREWLILGPVPIPENAKIEQEILPNEAQLAPDENDNQRELAWRKVTLDTAYLDFYRLFGKRPDGGAYACAYVHSDTGGPFRVNLTSPGSVRLLANGKPGQGFVGRSRVDLAKGWNRLLLKVWPGEKTWPGELDWYAAPVLHACPPAAYAETTIAWATPLPDAAPGFYGGGMGAGSPVIVGDRLYLPGEPDLLICLRKSDGKILWVRSNSYFDAATDEEKNHPAYAEAMPVAAKLTALRAELLAGPAPWQKLEERPKLEKELYAKMRAVDGGKYKRPEMPDIGYAGFTPATDGEFVHVFFGSGVSACYDLEGRRQWIRVDNRPLVEHGISSSPLLIEGKMVVFNRDLMAFDARTGQLAWQAPIVSHEGLNPQGFFHGTPCATSVGGVGVIALGNGTIVRASDGKAIFKNPEMGAQAIASPVVHQGTLFQLTSGSMKLFVHQLSEAFADPLVLPTRTVSVDTLNFPRHYLPWHLASPLVHEGLAYLMNNAGVLTVVDVGAGQVVYQRMLDLDPLQWHNEGAARGLGVSPALGGRHIYLFGNNGASLVIEPGRAYKQVAKNKLESTVLVGHWAERQERFVGNPVFEGRRLYVRGEGHLYAIGGQP
ncbi:MAG: hypothetical protein NTW87_06880 [Planctomycetota bacterium]|nr:hypothetical protein [Planctomycetota bacterium]